mmetsp:Transcript_22470/g.55679  ORF Transcript_22470/g.55679 Transcript_22470/m.55679 type:complete len:144 (+) Transcript_22470:2245-2676(+)
MSAPNITFPQGVLSCLNNAQSDWARRVLEIVKTRISRTKNTGRLVACAKVLAELTNFDADSSCRETAFQEIFKLLKHPYATVRVAASESLYLTLIAQDEEAFTKFEDSEGKTVLDLLDATPWPSNNSSVIADAVQRISHCTGF